MIAHDTDDRLEYVDRGLQFVLLAGVAIATGLLIVVAIGMGTRLEGFSMASVTRLLLIVLLLWPVYHLAPWQPGVTERVREWLQSNRSALALAAVLLLGSRLSLVPDVLATLIHLPFVQTAGFFFGAELFYRPYVGFEFGQFVRRFGQWYMTVFLVVVVSRFLVGLGRSVRTVDNETR